MRKAIPLSALLALVLAATAAAATGTITVTVSPDTPKSPSKLTVTAKGPFSASGLPKSLEIDVQKGFQSSAKSVPVLCKPSSSSCPKKSKVGSGKVGATVSLVGKQTIPFQIYLGTPQHKGDIASVVLRANVFGQPQKTTGRLFHNTSGALELLFSHFPSAPSSVSVKVDRFNLIAYAVRKVGSKRYSLVTNPPSCSGGHWTGDVKVTFKSSSSAQSVAIPCKK